MKRNDPLEDPEVLARARSLMASHAAKARFARLWKCRRCRKSNSKEVSNCVRCGAARSRHRKVK